MLFYTLAFKALKFFTFILQYKIANMAINSYKSSLMHFYTLKLIITTFNGFKQYIIELMALSKTYGV